VCWEPYVVSQSTADSSASCKHSRPPSNLVNTLPVLPHPSLLVGDFNSHHPDWGYQEPAVLSAAPFRDACLLVIVLSFYWPFSRWTWANQYQNVLILDFVGDKDDGSVGNSWSYKTCKAAVKLSPPKHQHQTFYRLDALPIVQPTDHWRKITKCYSICYNVNFETVALEKRWKCSVTNEQYVCVL